MNETYEAKRDEIASRYSDDQFALADNFTVMRDVCNGGVYFEAFKAGADWARDYQLHLTRIATLDRLNATSDSDLGLLVINSELKAKLELAKAALQDIVNDMGLPEVIAEKTLAQLNQPMSDEGDV